MHASGVTLQGWDKYGVCLCMHNQQFAMIQFLGEPGMLLPSMKEYEMGLIVNMLCFMPTILKALPAQPQINSIPSNRRGFIC
jgi:hypothetical protein